MAVDVPQQAFLMSAENECLTVVEGTDSPDAILSALRKLLEALRRQAPSLAGHGGLFNPYGRVYVDCGHLELAAAECDSPYLLAQVVERQEDLVARALAELERQGCRLRLANNNHSGLLSPRAAPWGSHENYLVDRSPEEFTEEILPFLVTRIYAGAGGILFPTGEFLAGARPLFMAHAAGGGTTGERAIHSTCREEHHMGSDHGRWRRYHLIVGDGHRSQFNLALQFGATALVLRAIGADPEIRSRVASAERLPLRGSWVHTLRHFNLLAKPGDPPRAAPAALRVQRVYLDAARRQAAALDEPPPWVPRLLADWEATLDALERGDRDWLSARLDVFAKHALYSAVLEEGGHSWKGLPGRPDLFAELALLDHSYHEFANPASVFASLEAQGLLLHRVGERIVAGGEPEPFVPETRTRAAARARFIKEHAQKHDLLMDWASVVDLRRDQRRLLSDPFAPEYSAWKGGGAPQACWRSILGSLLP